MILSLHVDEWIKDLYLQTISNMNQEQLDDIYSKLTKFIEKIELKEISEIKNQTFKKIAGMRKKEAEEKTRDINALSFLFHNI